MRHVKRGILLVCIIALLAGCVGCGEAPDSLTCRGCHHEYTDRANIKSISKRNLCESCYRSIKPLINN